MRADLKTEAELLLSEKLGRTVEIQSANSVGGGCIHHASRIETTEGPFFMKWNSECAADLFVREAEGLVELKKGAGPGLIIPEVIAAKEVDDSPGFLIMEYLQPAGFNAGNEESLGRGLGTLHQYHHNQCGFYHNNYCGSTVQNNNWVKSWSSFYRDNRLGFLLKLIRESRHLTGEEMKVYDKLLDRITGLVPDKSTPVLIHGDLWSGNYMLTTAGPALIDPAAYFADREMEFGIITMFGGFSTRFYEGYNEVNPLPPDWRERNGLYQLYHILNHYYLFGGGYGRQAFQTARRYL